MTPCLPSPVPVSDPEAVIKDHQEFDALVAAVTRVGVVVDIEGTAGLQGFIDQAKHPSWWADVPAAAVGDRLHVVVLDDSRNPPRLSALDTDMEIARRLRGGP